MRRVSFGYFLAFSSGLHAACLGLFGLSFTGGFASQHPPLVFLGQLLPAASVLSPRPASAIRRPAGAGESGLVPRTRREAAFTGACRKPAAAVTFAQARPLPAFPAAPAAFMIKKDPGVMIHPLLPYELQLYFQDRQSVHLELMFMITSNRSKKFIVIKRKISSGNLDADLLCTRYLGHYLFIDQDRFAVNTWQTVRIDLSR
jgi:hypothetical protein